MSPARQLVTMVKWGMTPAQALRTATVRGAELMQMQNDIGTLEPGKYADIIAVQGNPINDISVMQKITFVMKGGVVFKNSVPLSPIPKWNFCARDLRSAKRGIPLHSW
jgi:imidazolonepropionase-like amidohydrolase